MHPDFIKIKNKRIQEEKDYSSKHRKGCGFGRGAKLKIAQQNAYRRTNFN